MYKSEKIYDQCDDYRRISTIIWLLYKQQFIVFYIVRTSACQVFEPVTEVSSLDLKCSSINYWVFQPFKRQSIKWSDTLKQFVGNLQNNCLSVFDYFVDL